jgi:CRP-like cAMP-binding protein
MGYMFNSKSKAAEHAQMHAAKLLITDGALVGLSRDDALEVVSYMQPKLAKAGEVLIREGETLHSDFMILLMEGEVTVESSVPAAHDSMVVSILGPGSLIGDMGVVDGGPRSATCTAATDLALAVLTRDAIARLIDQAPAVAARLLMAMAKRMADHLRETNRKLMKFAQVAKAIQQELDAAHSVNRRLLDQISKSSAGAPPVRPSAPADT